MPKSTTSNTAYRDRALGNTGLSARKASVTLPPTGRGRIAQCRGTSRKAWTRNNLILDQKSLYRSRMDRSDLPDLKTFNAKSSLQHVFDELKRAIMMGEFAPGRKFRIDDLAKIFNTSHMPVREALNQLVVVGALESPPRRSTSIPEFSKQRLAELIDLRLIIESHALELAADNVSEADIKELTEIQNQLAALLGEKDVNLPAYLKLNYEFHFQMYRRCGNSQLLDMIELAWLRYGPMLNLLANGSNPDPLALQRGNRDHLKMIEGLRDKDMRSVKTALKSDLSDAASSILRQATAS